MRELVVFAALLIAFASCQVIPTQNQIGSDRDSNGCIVSAGYTWCKIENKCVRSWEVAKQQNLDGTRAQFDSYCNGTLVSQIGSDKDEHNCIISAGYSWCQTESACVRPWELARQKGLDGSKQTFDAYCSGQTQKIGGVKDSNGCLVGAGYTWCATENQCVQPWQLVKEKNLDGSQASITRYCTAGQVNLPGSVDANGCHRGTGYTWCATEAKCVRPWEVATQQNLDGTRAAFDSYCGNVNAQTQPIGGTQDPNGCVVGAGYTWCAAENKCVRPWELSRQKNLDGTRGQFDAYCAGDVQLTQPVGGATDDHGCIAGAGYTWCAAENDCVRPWELAHARGFDLSTASFTSYCAGTPVTAIGSDADQHGCIASAGYSWCQSENACVRPWELAKKHNLANSADAIQNYCSGTTSIGGAADQHGCIAGAGYTWCQAEGKCVRVWELAHQKNMSVGDAQAYCS